MNPRQKNPDLSVILDQVRQSAAETEELLRISQSVVESTKRLLDHHRRHKWSGHRFTSLPEIELES